MVHGIGLGGAALLGLGAALFCLYAAPRPSDSADDEIGARPLQWPRSSVRRCCG
jgi:hypothetical protein